MTEPMPNGARASGRWLAALVALAFVAGLTLMGYAARRWGWFSRTPVVTVAAPPPATASAPASAPAASLPSPPAADPTTLATREAALAGSVAALEARLAQITSDIAAAGDQAARAEAVLIVAAARRQVDAGQPLGYLEEQVRLRFGQRQPRSVAVLIAANRQPTTLDQLVAGLDQLKGRLSSEPEDDLFDALRRELATLVVLRRTGSGSPLVADRLAAARAALVAGRVGAARNVVATLPGAPAAGAWLAATGRWVSAHQALDALDAAALTVAAPSAPASADTVRFAPTTTTVLP